MVLPPEIAQLLPKGRLLSEVRAVHVCMKGLHGQQAACSWCPLPPSLPLILQPLHVMASKPDQGNALVL